MSESSFPFAGPAATAPPSAPEPEAAGDNRSKLLLLAGLAGALVLAVLAYFLFFSGGGSDPTDDSAAKPAAAKPVAPAPAETVAPQTRQRISAKSFGRDPFKPLIAEAAAAVAPVTGTAVAAVPAAPVVGTSPVTGSAGPSGSSGTVSAGGSTTTPEQSRPHSFKVVSVAPDNTAITVKVDGRKYHNLRAGEVFAKYFKVRLISGTSNAFQYGEERFNVLGTKRLTIA